LYATQCELLVQALRAPAPAPQASEPQAKS
jgi:hypothetical protein